MAALGLACFFFPRHAVPKNPFGCRDGHPISLQHQPGTTVPTPDRFAISAILPSEHQVELGFRDIATPSLAF